MDVSEPAAALAPALRVPVLRALSRRSTPATASQLWRAGGSGTLAGVQRTCDRLAAHGLVDANEMAGRVVYTLNHGHLLYDALVALLAVDGELERRITAAIEAWEVTPVCAALFGSAARRDGGTDSDIDLLLVRPRLAASRSEVWTGQVRRLRHDVPRWAGNRLDVVDLSRAEVARLVRADDPMVRSWAKDGVTLVGQDVTELVEAAS